MYVNVEVKVKFYETNLGFKKILSVPDDGDIFDFAILSKD